MGDWESHSEGSEFGLYGTVSRIQNEFQTIDLRDRNNEQERVAEVIV